MTREDGGPAVVGRVTAVAGRAHERFRVNFGCLIGGKRV